jgi:hypothetical protein
MHQSTVSQICIVLLSTLGIMTDNHSQKDPSIMEGSCGTSATWENSSSKHLTQSHSWRRRFQLEGFQKQGQLNVVAINGNAKEIGNAIQLLALRQSAVAIFARYQMLAFFIIVAQFH